VLVGCDGLLKGGCVIVGEPSFILLWYGVNIAGSY
jgi:hypothetical protein